MTDDPNVELPRTRGPFTEVELRGAIPYNIRQPGALNFWFAVVLTGIGAGLGAVVLLHLLDLIQNSVWPGPSIIEAGARFGPERHITALLVAGVITGITQIFIGRISAGAGIDVTTSIWFSAGRLPKLRTMVNAILSIVVVALGVSLGREGAPKQTGAVLANFFADMRKLSDVQRRLLVACGVGAGMAAAYGVPIGGALFSLEVLLGMLVMRMVLPALLCSTVATSVAWAFLPNAPTYHLPHYESSASAIVWSLLVGPIVGVFSVIFVRMIKWSDSVKPKDWRKVVAPILALTFFGVVSIWFPQVMGNGKDVADLAFSDKLAPIMMITLLLLKPMLNVLCLGSGTPGGLFTPSLTVGALLGGTLGHAWSWVWPGVPTGMCAVCGATAVIAATTHGPISALVLITELTNHDRAFLTPMLLCVITATMVARAIDTRSLYEAKLTDAEIEARISIREPLIMAASAGSMHAKPADKQ